MRARLIKFSIPALVLFTVAVSHAADPQVMPQIPAINGAVAVDGVLNEEAWRKALELPINNPFVGGAKPKDKAVVKLLMDATHLYAGFSCDESDEQGPWVAKPDKFPNMEVL